MMRQALRLLSGSLVLASVAVSLAGQEPATPPPPPPSGFADAILGSWDLTVQGAKGAYPSWLQVHLRKETQLQARFVGQFGSVRYASQVDYRDAELTVVVPVQYEQNKTDLRLRGRLAGQRLEGTTEDADGRTITWTAVRAPAVTPAKTPAWGAEVALFNGRDLAGWKPRTNEKPGCWQVVNGELTNTPPKCPDLVSERTFGDFKLHAEFSYPARSNSGIYLRGRYEVQIQDDAGKALDPLRMGGVYGFVRPYSDAARKAGEWQTYDITLVGRRVTIVLNGTVIAQDEVIPGITGGALDSDEGAPGPLVLQGDHEKVTFRKIAITPAQ